jgi:hypothetical protein
VSFNPISRQLNTGRTFLFPQEGAITNQGGSEFYKQITLRASR